MTERRSLRCAIYTRTSSDEGLSQDYNSLAAQRDACIAFILSQKHEGWVRTRRIYEDGGFTGGNLDRPALRDLLADLAAGELDIIVVYKIDRLTRSLRDFAKLSESLERYGGSFVAVTQQFNTASSMGRLTLNILLTFAQFEREVTGDRIRDKRASSTRVGIWMGGNPALGYDAPAKKLVVNPREAEVVRYIFRRFVELKSMAELRKDLQHNGLVSKRKIKKDGVSCGGRAFSWHPLRTILTNPLYRGLIRHKTATYPGRHEPIIDGDLFDEVQRLVRRVAIQEKAKRERAYPSLLRGIIFDRAGEPLYTHHTRKGEKRHNYYVSKSALARKHLKDFQNKMRVSAPVLERFVIDLLSKTLRDKDRLLLHLPTTRKLPATLRQARELANEVSGQAERNTGVITNLVDRIELDRGSLRLLLNRRWLYERLELFPSRGAAPFAGDPIEIRIEDHAIRCGSEMKVILENLDRPPEPDHRLIRGVLRATRWFNALASGEFSTIADLARSERCCPSLITNRIRLAFLAPDIVEAILEGRQPSTLTLARLEQACPLPISWDEQRALFM